MKTIALLGMLVVLAGCAGRDEPGGTFLDPVCLKDGSVAFRQLANAKGEYGEFLAKKEYCSWNQAKK